MAQRLKPHIKEKCLKDYKITANLMLIMKGCSQKVRNHILKDSDLLTTRSVEDFLCDYFKAELEEIYDFD